MNQQHRNGAAAELFTAYRLTSLGYTCYLPCLTQAKADLVVEIDGVLKKVQVKKATYAEINGNPFIQIRLGGCGRGEYREGDFDLLAMVFEGRLWLLPWELVKGHKSMSFAVFPGQRPRRDISQYEVLP